MALYTACRSGLLFQAITSSILKSYEDINYSVASTEDQSAIFSGWSSCLNYFDSSLPFQLSFVNRRSRSSSRYKVNIPPQEDDYNSIREEYVEMLKGQIAKSNNGIERSKYITFGLPAGSAAEARPRLGRDIHLVTVGRPGTPIDERKLERQGTVKVIEE